jgi:hypothetical protein
VTRKRASTTPPGPPPAVRALSPITGEGVAGLLRSALDDAVDGNVRGVVVLLRYSDARGYRHTTAGDLDLGDAILMFEAWKWQQFAERERKRGS